MKALIEELAKGGGKAPEFEPYARYLADMDMLLYVREDCSYRAERVDPVLTILWDPDREKDRLVGVKVKGFHHVFLQVKKALGLYDEQFLPLMKFVEAAFELGLGEQLTDSEERRAKYRRAVEVVGGFQVPEEELRKAAA